ncbi:beta-ketoacyl synthase N-terminal-like domain-containing protein [Salibacterium sp. K-3]
MNKKDPVVVTGIGNITPFGDDVEQFWDLVIDEKGAPVYGDILQQKVLRVSDNWNPENLLGKKGLKFMEPATKYLMAATRLALEDALLWENTSVENDMGIVVGCNFTSMKSAVEYDLTVLTKGPKFVSPMQAPNALANSPAGQMGIRFGAKASNTTISTGQSAGIDALGYALNLLNKGRADYVIVGGGEQLDEQIIWFYEQSGLLPPAYSSIQGVPFSKGSPGILASEGAGVVVLEKQSTAENRGATTYGEIKGWESGFSLNRKKDHRFNVFKNTIKRGLSYEEVLPEDIDLIVSGANGCAELDGVEEDVLLDLFNDEGIALFPVKKMIGESFGASGLFQLITALGTLRKQRVPLGVKEMQFQESSVSQRQEGAFSKSRKIEQVLLTSQNYSGEISTLMVKSM